MIELALTLHNFWSSFGIPVYRTADPRIQTAEMPYIVYNVSQGETLDTTVDYANIYYKSTQQQALFSKCDEIRQAIGRNKVLRFDGGNVVIWQPTFQVREDTDVSTAVYVSYQIDFNMN